MEIKSSKRNFGLDLTRFVAIFFVITVHSMMHNGFYDTSIEGLSMFSMLFLRNTSFLCVPLFLLLTGYLNKEATANTKYYKKIKKLVVSYIIISIIVILFKYFYFKNHDIISLIIGVTNYETINYAWYFEMYIGLFLLIPFLNILYKNINTQKQKLWLIISMILVTSIGGTLMGLKIDDYSISIMPNYWSAVYPITYYFIGSYICEYKVQINKYINMILLGSILFLQTIIMYYLAYGYRFTDRISLGYNNLFTIVEATLLFILVYNKETKSKITSSIISKISKVSFNMYLISVIFDFIIQKEVIKYINGYHRLLVIPMISIPTVFILSFISAVVIDLIVKLLLHNNK